MFQGLIWVGLALALLLALDRIFSSDFDDGNLDIILRMEVSFCKEKVSYLESVIKIMNNRQWNIRSAIEWRKFINGV